MPTEGVPQQRTLAERATGLTGSLAVIGLLWALGLAFIPASHEGLDGRRTIDGLSCGSPALFRQSSFVETRQDEWQPLPVTAADCAEKADGRIRSAVGVIVGTLPFTVLWLWGATTLRIRRAAPSLNSRTNGLEPDQER
ncbi:hypothetical protein [Streptomyces sp. NPDC057336]|uniref:hypothetical protein n=1 Tax=Streptomyces sp. NPDC057336 TaxID=3346102 RepID=UPI003625D880